MDAQDRARVADVYDEVAELLEGIEQDPEQAHWPRALAGILRGRARMVRPEGDEE